MAAVRDPEQSESKGFLVTDDRGLEPRGLPPALRVLRGRRDESAAAIPTRTEYLLLNHRLGRRVSPARDAGHDIVTSSVPRR